MWRRITSPITHLIEGKGECDLPIDDSFPDDHLLALATSNVPWFVDLVNYLAYGIVVQDMNYN